MQPSISTSVLDGQLGVLPPAGVSAIAIIAPAASGTTGAVVPCTKSSAVVSAFTAGPLVDAACIAIESFGLTVLAVKCAATTVGAITLDVTGKTGTSVVTATNGVLPNGNADVVVVFDNGGTIGTGGILYRYSVDGGLHYSVQQALGTANTILLPKNIGFSFAAGTIVTGDVVVALAVQPKAQAGDLSAPLLSLKNSNQDFEIIYLGSPVDVTVGAALDAGVVALEGVGRRDVEWIAGWRDRNAGETDAQYLTAFTTFRGTYSTVRGSIVAGDARVASRVPGESWAHVHVPAEVIAAKIASVKRHIDVAQIYSPGGALPGVTLVNANGNPDGYDERLSPGLNDQKAIVCKTWPKYSGTYVTNPWVFSANGSDFRYIQHTRVFNYALDLTAQLLIPLLSKELELDPKTGFLLPAEATNIENTVTTQLRSILRAEPMVSDIAISVSRTDNILATETLTVTLAMLPLGYTKQIVLTASLVNPARRSSF